MMMTEATPSTEPTRRLLLNLTWALLATDLALIALHLTTGLGAFDLDREANLATWYSSSKLLGVALLCATLFARTSPGQRGRRSWWIGALLFAALSADELASLHESLARWVLERPALDGLRTTLTGGDDLKSSHAWVWLFLPLIVAAVVFFAYLARVGLRGRPRAIVLLAVGLVLLMAAVGLEALVGGFPPVADWGRPEVERYRLLTTIEECAELFGVTALFAALAVRLAKRD